MSIKEFVEFIKSQNGTMHYSDDLTKEQEQIAKENGIVIVFGYSDDCAEFRGAIHDEADCYEGGTVFEENGYYINAEWRKGDICWTYDTNIPHETFLIYEDEDDSIYCQAIVFDYSYTYIDKTDKMTNERAIEILDPEHREHYKSIEPVNEACRLGMEALKKQIPKKLEFWGYDEQGNLLYDYAKCPVCGNAEFEYGINNWGCAYCPDCGQALDWNNA